MVANDRVNFLFSDARALFDDAIEMLDQGKIRNAAEKAWCATKRATEALVGTTGAKTSYKGRRLHLGGDHGSCVSITLVTTGPSQSKHRNSKAPERSLRGFAIGGAGLGHLDCRLSPLVNGSDLRCRARPSLAAAGSIATRSCLSPNPPKEGVGLAP